MQGIRPHKRMSQEEADERRRMLETPLTWEQLRNLARIFAVPLELILGPDRITDRPQTLQEIPGWEGIASSGIGRRWPYQGRF